MSTSKQLTHRQARARAHALEHIHTPVGRSNNIYYELKLQTNVGLTNEEEQSEKRASR